MTETEQENHDTAVRPRTSTTHSEFDIIDVEHASVANSEFDIIDIEKDVRCNLRGCSCSKVYDRDCSIPEKIEKHVAHTKLPVSNSSDGFSVNTTITVDSNSPICNHFLNGVNECNEKMLKEQAHSVNETVHRTADTPNISNLNSYHDFLNDMKCKTFSFARNSEKCDNVCKQLNCCDNYQVKLIGINDVVQPQTECSNINKVSEDLVEECNSQDFLRDMKDENLSIANNTEKSDHVDKLSNKCDNYQGNLSGLNEAFDPQTEYSINEDPEDLVEEQNRKDVCDKHEKLDPYSFEIESFDDKTISAEVDNCGTQQKVQEMESLVGCGDFFVNTDFKRTFPKCVLGTEKDKLPVEPVNGLLKGEAYLTSSSNKSSEDDCRHRRIR